VLVRNLGDMLVRNLGDSRETTDGSTWPQAVSPAGQSIFIN